MMTDPIADMLARVRNAGKAGHTTVNMPASRLKAQIARILEREGYINGFEVDEQVKAQMKIRMRYDRHECCVISGIRRRSRPGRRVYVDHSSIPVVYNGLGIAVMSTSKGLMTGNEARKQRMGGEVLCEVW